MSVSLWQREQTCWIGDSSGARPRSLRLRLNSMAMQNHDRCHESHSFIEIQTTNQKPRGTSRGGCDSGGLGYPPSVRPREIGPQSSPQFLFLTDSHEQRKPLRHIGKLLRMQTIKTMLSVTSDRTVGTRTPRQVCSYHQLTVERGMGWGLGSVWVKRCAAFYGMYYDDEITAYQPMCLGNCKEQAMARVNDVKSFLSDLSWKMELCLFFRRSHVSK